MTEMPSKNPYRPGAATSPLHLAGRDAEIRRFRASLRSAPEIPANLRLTGLRGVGKSVLLKELQRVAEGDNWASARKQLEPRHNTEQSLNSLIADLCRNAERKMSRSRALRALAGEAADALRRTLTVTFEDITIGLSGGTETEIELARALLDAAETAVSTGREGFVLMLDEAQIVRDDALRDGVHPLSMLIAAVNALQENEVPIGLVLCGLPTLRANLQKARTYSERMFKDENIGPLAGNPGPARDAFVLPLADTGVTAPDDLVDRVLAEVEGYPYFIQLWGAQLWDAAAEIGVTQFTVGLLDEIESSIYERLDEDFYAGRVEVLTPAEQDLLISSSQCSYPPLKTAEIRRMSERSDGNINVLMGRLTEQGVLFRVQKGQYEYTAPKFWEYLRRRTSA